uniref:Uncharacterized protein n=1 Tax=Marseillevirus LCMAC103 TaxID=2506604 RepID=A0A481YW93_9VIRU|nr:MAG: hypothetical protein LCMAC103_03890 [Marseillevirus LCMAC103]
MIFPTASRPDNHLSVYKTMTTFTRGVITFLSSDFMYKIEGDSPSGACDCGRFCLRRRAILDVDSDQVTDWNAYLEYASEYWYFCSPNAYWESNCIACCHTYFSRALEHGATNFETVVFAALEKNRLGCWTEGGCGIFDTLREWAEAQCSTQFAGEKGAALALVLTLYKLAPKVWREDCPFVDIADAIVAECEMTGDNDQLTDALLVASKGGRDELVTKVARVLKPSNKVLRDAHNELRWARLNRELQQKGAYALRKFFIGLAARPFDLSERRVQSLRARLNQDLAKFYLRAQAQTKEKSSYHLGDEEARDMLALLDQKR